MERNEVLNEVMISGRIVSMRGEGMNGSMTIACPLIIRTRRQGEIENSVRVNYPVVSFNKNTVTENVAEKFKRGDYVNVKAYAQSYLRMNDAGDTREILNVYIKEIEPMSSKMFDMFGQEGRTYPDARNEVYLSGVITGITKRNNALVIRLDASTKEKKNILTAVYYRASAEMASNFAIGDVVSMLAIVQTADTKHNTRIRDYQTLVIQDIIKN